MNTKALFSLVFAFGFAGITADVPLEGSEPDKLRVMFLGDSGPHRPRERFEQLAPVLKERSIEIVYTDRIKELNPTNLANFDALLLYANIDRIDPDAEKALLDYVNNGKGFVPIHCATYCFRNSEKIVALMGAQFRRHGTGVFRTEIVERSHPIMKGFGGFESWDETYVHHLHNEENRTVLSYRVDGTHHEPWTWVRTHGKGRVFYTAWGHDARTWGNPGFHNLVERGIRWAAGKDPALAGDFLADAPFPVPEMTALRTDVKPFEFIDVGSKIPNYTPSRQWGTQGEPFNKMQKPLPAEESIKHFVVPKGFHVELFVSEPQLGGKPICMTWDEQGRLWVAETYDYPNALQPPGQGRDRIRICEDTDGDWKADKFTVFAEGLSIPTSITFHRGGAIVQDGVRTLYLKDTDGDDVADERTVLLAGWNQRDTHGGVSNFQYGLDNWIWAMQGYNPSRPTPPDQADDRDDLQFAAGFFRFRPDDLEIEFIRSTNNNTWGLGISEEGIIFGSTANRVPSVYMPIPNRYYERVRGWTPSLVLDSMAENHFFKPITDNVRQVDHHGGYTAGAGHALYTARNYPREYWNRVAFVNGPTGHLVGTFIIKADGAGFRSRNLFNLLASDDEWSAPIMSEVGPDGNVWVIDWYNYIVQHNPTPRGFETGRGNAYRTDLRDKKHGRVYRIVRDDAHTPEQITLGAATADQLVAALQSTNMFWRKQAQRLLVERGKSDVLPTLFALVKDHRVDEIGLNTAAIHALWTIHGLGAFDGSNFQAEEIAVAALQHPSAGVRRNAVQVLPRTVDSTESIVSADLLNDSDAQVRLAAMLALADLPPTQSAGAALVQAATDAKTQGDRWLGDAVVAAAATNDNSFLKSAAQLDSLPDSMNSQVRIIAEHYSRGAPVDTVSSLITSLVKANRQVSATIVEGLAAGWPGDKRPVLDERLESKLEELVNQLDIGGRGQLLKLTSVWGSKRLAKYSDQIVAGLLHDLDNQQASIQLRAQAARRLLDFQSSTRSAVEEVLSRVTPRTDPALASAIVEALGGSQARELGTIVMENLDRFTPRVRQSAIGVLLSRRSAISALLDAMDRGDVQLAELSLDQRAALARHPDRSVRRQALRLLERGGALPNADRQKVLEDLLPITEITGDPAAGKLVFTKTCAKCHRHGGEGSEVGPDLTGMAAHPKDELLTHIIDPNRSVEGNFRSYSVVTVDGLVLNGMLASESRTAIELFDAEGKKTTILREDIDELLGTQKSLMPEGVEKDHNRTELADLLEFLTQRGSFAPVDFREIGTIASDRGMFNGGDGRYVLEDWSDRTVQGVPFQFLDPKDGTVKNMILLHGPLGSISSKMPETVSFRVNRPIRSLHLLSGVSGWGFPYSRRRSVSMIARFHYASGEQEDHELRNGLHFADYIRRTDVPESEFAFMVGRHQMRYLALHPSKAEPIERVELIKGPDRTAPIIMAATIEE